MTKRQAFIEAAKYSGALWKAAGGLWNYARADVGDSRMTRVRSSRTYAEARKKKAAHRAAVAHVLHTRPGFETINALNSSGEF